MLNFRKNVNQFFSKSPNSDHIYYTPLERQEYVVYGTDSVPWSELGLFLDIIDSFLNLRGNIIKLNKNCRKNQKSYCFS